MTRSQENAPARGNGRIAVIIFVTVLAIFSGIAVFTNLTHWPLTPMGRAPALPSGMEPLTVVTASGQHAFEVEVMRTDAERERGLMQRRFLPADRGMLFDFGREEPVAMWMKDTYIPLDMVFILKDGTVHRIAAETEPLSERIIESGGPVRAVLEINAGMAARIGLKPGDRIRHPLFGN